MMLDKPMNSLILKFLICRIEKASNYHLVQLWVLNTIMQKYLPTPDLLSKDSLLYLPFSVAK